MTEIQDEIERLRHHTFIPNHLPDIKTSAQVNALGVLEAMMDLVGQQLTYFDTFGAKLGRNITILVLLTTAGRTVVSVMTDTQEVYKNAGLQLKRNLAKFNQTLNDATFVTAVGIYSLLFSKCRRYK